MGLVPTLVSKYLVYVLMYAALLRAGYKAYGGPAHLMCSSPVKMSVYFLLDTALLRAGENQHDAPVGP